MTDLISRIREAVIGEQHLMSTPFGERPLVYADYTASGRSLEMIESVIRHRVMPYYANTHTETSLTGAQTTAYREHARESIREAVGATRDDAVIFCGSGATAAIHKLIDILNLRLPADLDGQHRLSEHIPESDRPVVLIGPYEHHSNELPWRETIARVVRIPLDARGQLDLRALEAELERHAGRSRVIGSFSAASNVTGIRTDVEAVTRLLKQHGALAFWDYAAAGPYVGIDMQGDGDHAKDAVFLSPHKFIGGPGTPGVLVVKKNLLNNRVPAVPGGGTVSYVTSASHRYVSNPERREEGGTPAIIESIRAGLVFRLQQAVGTDTIEAREQAFLKRALADWQRIDNLEILGPTDVPRLSIVSFRVRHGERHLHYGFVVALLNDLFGIQARGGCACAGPYGHTLLNIDDATSQAIEAQVVAGEPLLRPGWTRLNFNYFIDEATFHYLVRAVTLVAEHGWRLLPAYRYDRTTGTWRHHAGRAPLQSLADIDFSQSGEAAQGRNQRPLSDYLVAGEAILKDGATTDDTETLALSPEAEALRWFVRPQDVA
ncbi:aminotransferase class V-fold PLP-dependent enzyme [Marinobacter halodurans]|uniref:Aminotransferase class V-fold PLP-dependent enzyme n=1 Tax=Marinobacter halodurans TaxID=2528979 RepID=A0ABY1ZIT2_9GAMM|nr:aminotransferase class V-fold PLP-dependent enzyme [Marinobacter halodurans]TBW48730.1 aminotransferase class V-fold PLP-dependent enzyme [Marinobacter halodurans]